MKPLRLLSVAVLLACAVLARADGIPVDREKGEVTCPHLRVELTAAQQEEIETLGTLTLEPAQWAEARKKDPTTPKRFATVVSRHYDGCTCCMPHPYAIQLSAGRAALLVEPESKLDAEAVHALLGPECDELGERVDGRKDGENYTLDLCMDRRGQVHVCGVLIPFKGLIEALGTPRQQDGEGASSWGQAWVHVRLPVDVGPDAPQLKGRLAEIRQAAEKGKWVDFVQVER